MPNGTVVAFGDTDTAWRSASVNRAMAEVWHAAANKLRTITFENWTGEAADAARTKLAAMGDLMFRQHTVLDGVAGRTQMLAGRYDQHRRMLSDLKVADENSRPTADTGTASGGILTQGVGNVVIEWVTHGVVQTCAFAAFTATRDKMTLSMHDTAAFALGQVSLMSTILVGNFVKGVFSAFFFEGGAALTALAIGDDGFSLSGRRIGTIAGVFVGADTVGLVSYGIGRAFDPDDVAKKALVIGSGFVAGVVGGIAGPFAVGAAIGVNIPWGVNVVSVVTGAATAPAAAYLAQLSNGPATLAAIRARLAG